MKAAKNWIRSQTTHEKVVSKTLPKYHTHELFIFCHAAVSPLIYIIAGCHEILRCKEEYSQFIHYLFLNSSASTETWGNNRAPPTFILTNSRIFYRKKSSFWCFWWCCCSRLIYSDYNYHIVSAVAPKTFNNSAD